MTIYDNVARNLQKLIEEKNSNALSMSKAVGVSPSMISRFLNREIVSINLGTLIKISDYFDIDLLKLLGENSDDKLNEEKKNEPKLMPDYDYISFYDAKTSARSERFLPVEKNFTRKLGYPSQMLAAVEIAGDGMEPTLKNGDCVIIYHSDRPDDFVPGIYAIRDLTGIKVKRLDTNKFGAIEATSDNKYYKPQTYSQDEINKSSITLIGRVVGRIGTL